MALFYFNLKFITNLTSSNQEGLVCQRVFGQITAASVPHDPEENVVHSVRHHYRKCNTGRHVWVPLRFSLHERNNQCVQHEEVEVHSHQKFLYEGSPFVFKHDDPVSVPIVQISRRNIKQALPPLALTNVEIGL
jgi:hypothetical protein